MSKHTPGPWFISYSTTGMHKYVEARISGGMIQEVACCGPTASPEESNTNARLIAAAPELLEACKVFVSWLDDDGGESLMGLVNKAESACRLARAAIAKATGEQDEDTV